MPLGRLLISRSLHRQEITYNCLSPDELKSRPYISLELENCYAHVARGQHTAEANALRLDGAALPNKTAVEKTINSFRYLSQGPIFRHAATSTDYFALLSAYYFYPGVQLGNFEKGSQAYL